MHAKKKYIYWFNASKKTEEKDIILSKEVLYNFTPQNLDAAKMLIVFGIFYDDGKKRIMTVEKRIRIMTMERIRRMTLQQEMWSVIIDPPKLYEIIRTVSNQPTSLKSFSEYTVCLGGFLGPGCGQGGESLPDT